MSPGLERHPNRLYSDPYQMEMDYIPHQIMGVQLLQQYSSLLPVARADRIDSLFSYQGGAYKHPFCNNAEDSWREITENIYLPFLRGEVVVRRVDKETLNFSEMPFDKDSPAYSEAVSKAVWKATKPIDNNLHPVAIKQLGANTGLVLIPETDKQSDDGSQKLVPWLTSYPVLAINSSQSSIDSSMDHPVVLKRAEADLYNSFEYIRTVLKEHLESIHDINFGDGFMQTPPHVVLIRKLRLDVDGAEIQQKIFE